MASTRCRWDIGFRCRTASTSDRVNDVPSSCHSRAVRIHDRAVHGSQVLSRNETFQCPPRTDFRAGTDSRMHEPNHPTTRVTDGGAQVTDPVLAEEDHAVFWKWVCDRRAHDNPRGDFIRDTRTIRSVHDPNEAWWEVCPNCLEGASPAAYGEYKRLVREFNSLPKRPKYDSQKSTPHWTSRLRKMLLPYCEWQHESGRVYLVNRYYEPIWTLDSKRSKSWHEIHAPLWVSGQFESRYLYNDLDVHEYVDDTAGLAKIVLDRMINWGLPVLPSDCRDHSRATEGPVTSTNFQLKIYRQSVQIKSNYGG